MISHRRNNVARRRDVKTFSFSISDAAVLAVARKRGIDALTAYLVVGVVGSVALGKSMLRDGTGNLVPTTMYIANVGGTGVGKSNSTSINFPAPKRRRQLKGIFASQ